MSFKQFYLLSLLGISFFGFLILFLIWFSNRRDDKNKDYRGLLYIALAFLSWSFVALYKWQDNQIINLSSVVNDRVISAFSNLFLFASLPYFTNAFNTLRYKFSFFRNREQWVINVFIAFTIITTLFSYADRKGDSLPSSLQYLIIAIDSFISIGIFSLVCFALFQSLKKVISNSLINNVFLTVFILLPLTQLILPLTKVFPLQLSFLYPYTLTVFLISLACFISIINTYFLLYFSIVKNSKTISLFENNSIVEQEVIAVNKIIFDFDETTRDYMISLIVIDNYGKEFKIVHSSSKILRPFAHWLLFALAKKQNVFLFENDISVTKFRMVEYLNKKSDLKIQQDQVFTNNGGVFSLKLDAESIEFQHKELFQKSYVMQEIFRIHAICFISKDIVEKENLKNSKSLEKYLNKNIDDLYSNIFCFD